MNHKVNLLTGTVSILLLVSLVVAGCRQADVGQAASAEGAERKAEPATTNAVRAGTTSSEERGAVVRAGDGEVVAKSRRAEASAGNGGAKAGDAVARDGEARARNAAAGDGEARAGNVVAGEGRGGVGSGESSSSGRVILKVGGKPGTEFSGTCVMGGREEDLAGRVPGRFVYELAGRNLECEVREAEPSAEELEVSLGAGSLRRETMVRGQGDEVSFALTEQGTAFSTFSSGSGGSVNQQTKVTSSSSSSEASSSGTR